MKPHNRWLEFEHEDLKMAKLAFEEEIYNQVCFHSQQAVEKALKYLIQKNGKVPPKTHKLIDLIQNLNNKKFSELKEKMMLLDRFYIPTRYPDTLPVNLPEGSPNKKDATEALEIAQCFLNKI